MIWYQNMIWYENEGNKWEISNSVPDGSQTIIMPLLVPVTKLANFASASNKPERNLKRKLDASNSSRIDDITGRALVEDWQLVPYWYLSTQLR